jgi:small subunit ribosomal protein S1
MDDSNNISSELDKLYTESIKDIKEGEIIKAKIIQVRGNDVMVDVGYKAEGILSKDEFLDPDEIEIGKEIDVYVERKENDEGLVIVSKKTADVVLGWDRIAHECKIGDVVEGKVIKRVKGGLLVNIGIEAFLPGSLIDFRAPVNMDSYLGKKIKCMIVNINHKRKNVVVSRKDVLLKSKESEKKKFLEKVKPGDKIEGIVKNITDYGAFVELGPIDGLLHISDMSWGRISHPSELVAVGDRLELVVLDVDEKNERVSLGLKQKTSNPWQDIDKKYPVGSKIKGKIVNIVPYGAFIEIEEGIEGFVHISDLSWTKRIRDTHEVLAIGDIVEAIVLSVDLNRKKLSLGIKQVEQDPWQKIEKSYPLDSVVKGKIVGFNEMGAFVELGQGIEGFLNKNDISWTRKINHPSEVLKRGQKLELKVIGINKLGRRILLGLKQMIPDPWLTIEEKYKPDMEVKGKVVSVMPFGMFVEIEHDLEGLLHISEMEDVSQNLYEKFSPGDKIKVKILSLDKPRRQIKLTMKGISS